MYICTHTNKSFLWYYLEQFCIAALIFLNKKCCLLLRAKQKLKSKKMCPRAPFPLGNERVLEDRRSKLSTSKNRSQLQIWAVPVSAYFPSDHTLECMHFLPQQNKHKTHSHSKLLAVRTAAAGVSKREGLFEIMSVCSSWEIVLPRAPRHRRERPAAKMQLQSE